MSRVSYVDGRFVPHAKAMVSMEDRGYQFADGIYEVIARYQGHLVDAASHLDRLERSLGELGIAMPMSRAALELRVQQLIDKNNRTNGLIYMQVTRGVSARNHIPRANIRPVLTMAMTPARFATDAENHHGVKVITHPDERWARCDIKSIGLLPNSLARQAAARAGAKEAWLVRDDGTISEGSLSNAYIVKDGVVYTHPADRHILGGVRRARLIAIANQTGVRFEQRAFTLEDVKRADEAFITSASTFVLPVARVDDITIGAAKPGPVTTKLREAYMAFVLNQPEQIR